MRVPLAMLGVLMIGIGASPIPDASTNAWGWGLMVASSLVGGLNVGVAFARVADQAVPPDASRQPTIAR